jgi:MFS family permease
VRGERAALFALLGYWGFVAGVNGAVAPLLAESFAASDAALASALGWIGFASLGALALGHVADRIGRRRVALAAAAGLPFAAAGAAMANSLTAYVAAQLVAYACGTTLLGVLIVLTAERAPGAARAAEQGRAGLAFTIGTALPLLICASIAPDAASHADRWRFVWAAAVAPVVVLPLVARRMRESDRWRRIATRPRIPSPRAPSRDLRMLLAASTSIAAAEIAARSWLFFHAVRGLGVSPRRALAVIALGGAASLLGFAWGGRVADRHGRRFAFEAFAALFALGVVGYFGVSHGWAGDPTGLLVVSFAAMGVGGNAASTAFRSLATELAPTRARGRLAGALAVAQAAGWIASMFAISALASALGSIGFAVCALVLVAVGLAMVAVLAIPETADRDLDALDAEETDTVAGCASL